MKVWNSARQLIEWTRHHHAPMHEDSGVDEISVAGLDGKTAELTTHESTTHAPTGFPNRTDSTLSFDTITFTIAPSNGSFDYYIAGVKYTKSSSEGLAIDDNTSGVHVVYYDGSTLSESVNPSDATMEDLIKTKALVGIIYWNATDNAAYLLADERHGTVMSGSTHHWLHDINGAAYDSGLTLSGYTEATDSDAALTFELTDGKYYDEDLEHSISDGTPTNQYEQQLNGGDAEITIVYKDDIDGSWKEDAASTLPYKTGGTGRLAYNKDDGDGTFSQVEVTDGKWVSMTLIATNDWQYPIKAIQGQNEYTDKKTAVEQATAEIISFGGGTLSPEVLTLYRFVMQTKDTFGGTKKAKIEVGGVTDFRTVSIIGGAAIATDHGALSGLADDDHAQYILHSLADASGDFLVASGNDTFAKQTTAQALATLSPLTTRGDIMFRNATVSTRLAKGAENTLLVMGADDPAWSATLAGLTLTSPTINGTIATTGLTLPTFTLSGAITGGSQVINSLGHIGVGSASDPLTGISYAKTTLLDASCIGGLSSTTRGYKTSSAFTKTVIGTSSTSRMLAANTQNWSHTTAGMRAMLAQVIIEGGASGTVAGAADMFIQNTIGAGTVTNLYGIWIQDATGAGAVTNQYGIKIGALAKGATLNYAIHNLSAPIYTGGYIEQLEMAAPGAGAANTARIYAVVGGDTLTDLSAVFQDGSIDNFATETTPENSPLFTTPSGTPLQVRLRKDHPGQIRIVAVFPGGEEFDLKHHKFHDADKIAANVACDSSLPDNWEVTTLQERVNRNIAVLDGQIEVLNLRLPESDKEFKDNSKKLDNMVAVTTKEKKEKQELEEKQVDLSEERKFIVSELARKNKSMEIELERLK